MKVNSICSKNILKIDRCKLWMKHSISFYKKNSNSDLDKTKVVDFTRKVLEWIPDQVKDSDSFSIGSRGNGKYISINIMNYLIFQDPGISGQWEEGRFRHDLSID